MNTATRRLAILAATSLAAAVLPARAAPFGEATVPYMADMVMIAGGQTMPGRMWSIPKVGHRRQQAMAGREMVSIVRRDLKKVFILFPANRSYMEKSYAERGRYMGFPSGEGEIKRTRVGRERVSGVATTKYRVTGRGAKGQSFSGFMWVADKGVVMKIVSDATGRDKFEMTLSNLRVGPVDRKLLELPKGWSRIRMPGAPSGRAGAPAGRGACPMSPAQLQGIIAGMRKQGASPAQIQAFRRRTGC